MFLNSLIERHRGDDAGTIVQPRPRSRFEQETGFLQRDNRLSRAQIDESQENVKVGDMRGSSFQQKPYATKSIADPISPHPTSQFEQKAWLFPGDVKPSKNQQEMGQDVLKNEDRIDSPGHQRFVDSKTQGDSVAPRLFSSGSQGVSMHQPQSQPLYGKQFKTDETISKLHDELERTLDCVQTPNESFPLNPTITSTGENRTKEENVNVQTKTETPSDPIRERSFQSELSQRIHVLLQRLQPHVEPSQDRDADSERFGQWPVSEVPQLSIIKSGQEASLSPSVEEESVTPLDSSKFMRKPIEDYEINRRSLEVGGALQIPAWLSDLQMDLRNQLKEMNTKSEAESVVNVTIGRVEIRAVQAEPVRQPKPQKKSTGVMSLDDYLQQRAYGGQR